ncbi:MAG: hypothetical protein WCE63_04460 [Acidobacteriaceae bacterium]
MTHNYTVHDIVSTAAIVPVFAIFLFFPGYSFGWFTDLLQFRSSSISRRILLSLPLSLVISTIATNLLGRYLSSTVILWGFCVVAAATIFHLTYTWARRPKTAASGMAGTTKIACGIAIVWAIVVIASLADVQIGSRLYANTALWDHAVRIAFLHSAMRTGPPIRNPFSYLGSAPIARYYYYWYVLCSYPARLTNIDPRCVLYGSSVWSGFLLAALIPLYLRDFLGVRENLRRKSVIGFTLIAVTGLDIVPTLYEFFRAKTITPDMEWWDPVQITSWTDALIWVPHHVTALVACLIGFLALWNVRTVGENASRRLSERWIAGIFAAFAFVAAAGLSVYVTFAFAIFLLVWGFRLLAKRVYPDFFLYLGTACCTILFALPYLHDLLAHPAAGAVAAGAAAGAGAAATGISVGPFALGLRVLPNFLSTPMFLKVRGFSHPGLLAPFGVLIVYILEFGVFAAIAWARFRRDMKNKSQLGEAEIASWTMLAVGMFVITFVRSAVITNNDLAFRSAMIVQFVVLLWAAEFFDGWFFLPRRDRLHQSRGMRFVVHSTLILGFVAAVYSLTILRTYAVFDDKGMIAFPADWFPVPHEVGTGLMNIRQAYDQLDKILPAQSIVQYNPMREDYLPLLEYDSFQSVDAFPDCGTEFGGDTSKCSPVQDAIATLFNTPGEVNIRELCSRLSIDVLVARKTDAAWQDRNSWVWTNPPLVANSYIRAFRCR